MRAPCPADGFMGLLHTRVAKKMGVKESGVTLELGVQHHSLYSLPLGKPCLPLSPSVLVFKEELTLHPARSCQAGI